MKAVYEYNSGSTQADIVNDIVAILTGETNPASLSSACNEALTSIIATVASGWTLHDATAGTNAQVIKAPYSDNGTDDKFLKIESNATTRLIMHGYENWDAGSNTGTNATGNPTTSEYQYMNSTNGGRFYLFASSKFVCIVGEEGTNYGDNSYKGPTLFTEYTRIAPWNVTSENYPSAAIVQLGGIMAGAKKAYHIKLKDKNGVELTGANAISYGLGIGTQFNGWTNNQYFPMGIDAKVPDHNDDLQIYRLPVYLGDPDDYAIPLGEFSTLADAYMAPGGVLAYQETVDISSVEYIAMKVYTVNDMRILLRNN